MIEHLREREKALEQFGWTGREAEWFTFGWGSPSPRIARRTTANAWSRAIASAAGSDAESPW